MYVATVSNQKGGVGKTTTCAALSYATASMGLRTIVVDNDPQSSLTQGLLGPEAAKALAPEQTIYAVYTGDPPLEDVVHRTVWPNLDFVPGSAFAGQLNNAPPHAQPEEYRHALRRLVGALDGYDVVLIDCPPNLHLCTWAAMVASDGVILPVQPEDYGIQGLADCLQSVRSVRSMENPRLGVLGYLITMAERKAMHQHYEAMLRGLYGAAVFQAVLPRSVDFIEATYNRLPVGAYKPRGASAKRVQELAREFLARVAAAGVSTEAA